MIPFLLYHDNSGCIKNTHHRFLPRESANIHAVAIAPNPDNVPSTTVPITESLANAAVNVSGENISDDLIR
jgi:hypothetical protein